MLSAIAFDSLPDVIGESLWNKAQLLYHIFVLKAKFFVPPGEVRKPAGELLPRLPLPLDSCTMVLAGEEKSEAEFCVQIMVRREHAIHSGLFASRFWAGGLHWR